MDFESGFRLEVILPANEIAPSLGGAIFMGLFGFW